MDELRIHHNLHLFVDTTNAPNADVFDSINSVCKQLDAQILIMAARKKVRLQHAEMFPRLGDLLVCFAGVTFG